MSYENAPATQMLATHCAICARPLCDATSVEAGIGPDCRARYGYNITVDPVARDSANKLVHELAVGGLNAAECRDRLQALHDLNFTLLSDRIAQRLAPVRIEAGVGGLWVRTPWEPAAVAAFKRIPGRRWREEERANVIPLTSRSALWVLLRTYFPGALGVGPKGVFLVS